MVMADCKQSFKKFDGLEQQIERFGWENRDTLAGIVAEGGAA